MAILTYFSLVNFCSTVSFSATNYLIEGFNTPNDIYLHDYDHRIYICTKSKIVMEMWVSDIGVMDWRANKESENWKLLPIFFFKSGQLLSIGISATFLMNLVYNYQEYFLNFTKIEADKYLFLERWKFVLKDRFKIDMVAVKCTDFSPQNPF